MADVGGRTTALAERVHHAEDRGQLILVTALAMAIIFVTLALILNTAIYTENLATRSGDIGGGTDAVRYHDAARDGVGGMIDYVNAHNNTSHSALRSNLSTGVDDFRNHSSRLFAAGDRSVETNLATTEDGTRIAQSDGNRNFSNRSGTENWTVVEDVNNARAIEVNVTADSDLKDSGDEFELVFDDGSNTWVLNVTTGGTVGITHGSGETFTCTESPTPTIDVTAGTVDGTDCKGLEFAEGIGTPFDVSINNGDNVTGTYSMVVDNDSLADSPAPHLVTDGNGQPFAAHAVYSANVTVTYQTPRLFYNTTVRVAPGESDG